MPRAPLTGTARRLRPAEAKVVVVDTLDPAIGGWGMARFYGDPDWAMARAVAFIDEQDDADTGRYGIDASTWCQGCRDYHSPEADCA